MLLKRSPILVLALAGGLLSLSQGLLAQPPAAPAPPTAPATPAKPGEAQPAATGEKLPTGKEVFAKALEATGPEKARKELKTRVSSGTIKIESQGVEGKFDFKIGEDRKMINTVDLGDMGKVVRWTDGKKGAESQPGGQARLLTGDDLVDALRNATLFPEATPDAFFKAVETKGIEKVDGKDCYKVETTSPSGEKRSWFYSKETGLLAKWSSVKKRGPMEVVTDTLVSDWKDFDGVKVAMTQKQVNSIGEMSFEILIHTDKLEHNAKLTDADLAAPAELKDILSGDPKPKDDAKPAAPSEAPEKRKPKPDGK